MINRVTPIKPDFDGLEVCTTTPATENIAAKLLDMRVLEVPFALAKSFHSGLLKMARKYHLSNTGEGGAANAVAASLNPGIRLQPVDCNPLRNPRFQELRGILLIQLAYFQGPGGSIGGKLLHRQPLFSLLQACWPLNA
jgi:hypothetical protein